MKKIPTIFLRDFARDPSRVTTTPNPECEWVFAGEGIATRKIDGTSCMVRDGKLYKRREVKDTDPLPPEFETADIDNTTGKAVGWMPVTEAPEDRWHREAFPDEPVPDGTYELIGPKVQGNPEGSGVHILVRHGDAELVIKFPPDRTFDGLRDYLAETDIEGIVFHHPDGRMAKIKGRDFGFKRKKRA